jgi:putative ATPase
MPYLVFEILIVMKPLAERMRPTSLSAYIGQQHLTGKNGVLSKAIEQQHLPSMILWGPPGVGKTTLALILAQTLNRDFYLLSAINSGVKDIREVIEKSKQQHESEKANPVLFIDEIHRFSKSQQDALLGAVEKGWITLIGATTENPSFEVIAPLLSRCQVYILNHLSADDLRMILHKSLQEDIVLKEKEIIIEQDEALLRLSGGDARKLLNLLELVVQINEQNGKLTISNEMVEKTIFQKMALYDKSGDQHYDIISAFIKSIRGSDPNAAVYWLARMIQGGEDPLFIARRMLILASEDIGNANPNALLIANQCFDAVNKIGYPECRIILSQACIYLACSPKSNTSYMAIEKAIEKVIATGDLPVPLHLRNSPTKLMKELGYGSDYDYAHSHENNFSAQEYLPGTIVNSRFYEPGQNARENEMRDFLKQRWQKKYGY